MLGQPKSEVPQVLISYEFAGNKLEIPADKIVIKISEKEYPLSILLFELHRLVKFRIFSRYK